MAIHEYSPQDISPHDFDIYLNIVENQVRRHIEDDEDHFELEHHVMLHGYYLGLIHLEHVGDIAVSDGFYEKDDGMETSLSDQQWNLLALKLYSEGIIKARRLDHPGGQTLFLEAL